MLKKLLETIRNETVPLPGHPDPGALNDCWNGVFELLEAAEQSVQSDVCPGCGAPNATVINSIHEYVCEECGTRR